MCWRCAMAAADRAAARELQASQEYDWRQIILTLKQNHKMRKESTVAWALGISPGALSDVKKGRRSMPDSALKILKEKYSECIKMRILSNQGLTSKKFAGRHYPLHPSILRIFSPLKSIG